MSIQVFIDAVQAVSLILVLSIALGSEGSRDRLDRLGPEGLGMIFGLIAGIEMLTSFAIQPGLIVDLRNVPIALAGAFLGVRGMVAAVGIAVAVRLSLGGVGATSGAIGIAVAGCAGAPCASATGLCAVTSGLSRRVRNLVALGFVVIKLLCLF